ncbi:M23 family metallopeptidase [Staphylococcus pseudoxylosus]|uniref:M23 family metallopeptidase n=1 Tax=Staphylococcus pseudoxylosus TaxID=2282419 RepID=UPI001F293468|nr:peptidoglycan DD-metalloendopeptidase family protein [Staphylococcus pseudoxylosus]MCE5000824.1 M23 family metallopeptidase [Staphylococcus pseudoxylosus]
MKKFVTATIATLSLGAIGIAQGEAQASENDQSNSQYSSNQSSNSIFNYGYIDQDASGNYHHTLDGNWDQSMFDQQQYYFYLIDGEGNYHYFYFPMNNQSGDANATVNNDNNYSANQSHEAVQKDGYDVNQNNNQNDTQNINSSDEVSAQTSSEQATSNVDYNDSYTRNDGNGKQNVQQNATSNETSNATSNATTNTTAQDSTNQSTSNNTSDSNATSNSNSSNWLTKNRQLQPYGQYHGGGAHYGVDYAMPENTPVYSLTDGTVIQSGWSNYGGGNQVTIQEKNSNNYQWYMHMNSLNVQKGQQVKEGQQIGASGSTGNSTAPHLHFQRMQGGVGNQYSVDPTSYVNSKA